MHLASVWSFGVNDAQEIAEKTYFVPAFANVIACETSEGLVLIDTGPPHFASEIRDAVRKKTKAPLHTVIFTHGHIDHALGLRPWLEEGRPRVVAHRAVLERFDRYQRMTGLNEHVNRTQFSLEQLRWPRNYPTPDQVYDDRLDLTIGGETFALRHGKGETDDATWVWIPKRKVVCTGDFWIGCAPNCGNPQKVQRYAEAWADVLEAMAAFEPELLLPGHGPLMKGKEEIRTALHDTSRYLRSIVSQVIEGLNAGKRHEEIVASVVIPKDLVEKPYLQPLYDRPEFIARNVLRLYSGWWSGFASELLPAAPEKRAQEIAALAGGVDALVARAKKVAETDLSLACHLVEWATLADPNSVAANEAAQDIFHRRGEGESSLMGRSIFERAARDAEKRLLIAKGEVPPPSV